MQPYNTVKDKTPSKRIIWLGLLSVIIWFFLIRVIREKASVQELFLASAIYFFSILPTLIYFKRQEKSIPYLPIFGIIYFIYYAYPLFNKYETLYSAAASPDNIIKVLILVLLGLVSLLLGFYTSLGAVCKLIPHAKIPWSSSKAFYLGVLLGCFGILMQYLSVSGYYIPLRFDAIVSFAIKLPILAIVILYMLQLQKKLYWGGRVFLWLFLVPFRFIFDVIEGLTYPLFLDIVVLLLIYIQHRQRIPWKGIIVAGLIFFFFFSVRDEYRFLISKEGPKASTSTIERSLLYVQLMGDKLLTQKKEFEVVREQIAVRTNNFLLFSRIVYLTPVYIPYWGGVTYHTILYTIFPRLIIADKVSKNVGQEFGHRYMFLDYDDTTTSLNLPQLIEMYVNFGPAGVIIGMFIIGLIYRSLYALLNHPEAGEGGFLIGLMAFRSLLDIESDFSMVFGALIQYIILFYLIIRLTRLPITKVPR